MEPTKFDSRSDISHSYRGGLETTPLGAALSSVGFNVPEINFIVNSDYRVANLKICKDGQGNLQGAPEDCELLMRVILDRLRPELACNFFLACPFAAQKQIVAQPQFLELAKRETVDEKQNFSTQLALLVATAQNLNEEVPTEMVTGAAYPAWVMEGGFKEAYDQFCHQQNNLNIHREGQQPTDPTYSEEESSSSQGGNEAGSGVQAAAVSGHLPKKGTSSVDKDKEQSPAKLPVSQELKDAIDSAFDPTRKLRADGELKEARAALKLLSAGSPVNPSTFWFVGKDRGTGYLFSNAKLLCQLFAVPHLACLQFLFEAMGSANDEVKEKIKATLKGYKLGSLLLNTVTKMAWDQKEGFKSVGSLDTAKKILELLDQRNEKEMARFNKAIGLMHFSDSEIVELFSVLKDVGNEPTTNCVVM